ncbi:MAG: hypothetical protein QM662_13630 [Gordonia sp. (in: high G+C Gram-positive bacteria)]
MNPSSHARHVIVRPTAAPERIEQLRTARFGLDAQPTTFPGHRS